MSNLYKSRKFNYKPAKHGAVTAIRIYFADERTPMAELKFAYTSDQYPDKTETICWVQPEHREAFSAGINGYTLIYDERDKAPFENL